MGKNKQLVYMCWKQSTWEIERGIIALKSCRSKTSTSLKNPDILQAHN